MSDYARCAGSQARSNELRIRCECRGLAVPTAAIPLAARTLCAERSACTSGLPQGQEAAGAGQLPCMDRFLTGAGENSAAQQQPTNATQLVARTNPSQESNRLQLVPRPTQPY